MQFFIVGVLRTFNVPTCIVKSTVYPKFARHGSILLWSIAPDRRHLVRNAVIGKASIFIALKRNPESPSNQGAGANSLPIHNHLCVFRKDICHLKNWK